MRSRVFESNGHNIGIICLNRINLGSKEHDLYYITDRENNFSASDLSVLQFRFLVSFRET